MRLYALVTLAACSGTTADSPITTSDSGTPSGSPTGVGGTATGSGGTPSAAPFEILDGQTAADGCTLVELHTDSWAPIHAAYNPNGSDPFFQLHDMEEGLYFNVELYTVFGAGWTGQLGTFPTDCTTHGICAYFCPGEEGCFLADGSGTIDVDALAMASDALVLPVDVTLHELSMHATPPNVSEACYHIAEVRLNKE